MVIRSKDSKVDVQRNRKERSVKKKTENDVRKKGRKKNKAR